MKRTFQLVAIAVFLFFVSCGKDGGSSPADTLIPDLSAAWINTADATDQYFFVDVPNAGKASSTFDGNNNYQNAQHTFSGSYQNSKISFTFNDGPKKGQTYSGKINGNAANATMTLTTPSGGITLKKQ